MEALGLDGRTEVSESCSVVSDSLRLHGLFSLWNSPGQNTGVGSYSLLQQIFLTQESNQGLLHCRQILCQLSYQESPWNLRVGLKMWVCIWKSKVPIPPLPVGRLLNK